MPIIPKNTRQPQLRQQFQTPQVTSAFVELRGKQLSQFGNALSRGASQISRYVAAKEKSDQVMILAQSRNFAEKLALASSNQAREAVAGTNGDGLVEEFAKNFDTQANEYLQTVSEDYRPIALKEIETARSAVELKLIAEQPEIDLQYKTETTDKIIGNAVENVFLNPSLLQTKTQETEEFVAQGLQLEGPALNKYSQYVKKSLANAAIEGLIENNKFSEAKDLIKQNADLFGVSKKKGRTGELGSFATVPELLERVDQERSRNMDMYLKGERVRNARLDRLEEEQKSGVSEILDRRMESVRNSGDATVEKETLKYINTLEDQRILSPLAASFRRGQITDYNQPISEDNETSFILSAKIASGADYQQIEREIMVAATSNEISYPQAERLLRLAKTGGQVSKVDKQQLRVANSFIESSFSGFLRNAPGAAELKIEMAERMYEYIGEGYAPVDAAKKAVKELKGNSPFFSFQKEARNVVAPTDQVAMATSKDELRKILKEAKARSVTSGKREEYTKIASLVFDKIRQLQLDESLEGVE